MLPILLRRLNYVLVILFGSSAFFSLYAQQTIPLPSNISIAPIQAQNGTDSDSGALVPQRFIPPVVDTSNVKTVPINNKNTIIDQKENKENVQLIPNTRFTASTPPVQEATRPTHESYLAYKQSYIQAKQPRQKDSKINPISSSPFTVASPVKQKPNQPVITYIDMSDKNKALYNQSAFQVLPEKIRSLVAHLGLNHSKIVVVHTQKPTDLTGNQKLIHIPTTGNAQVYINNKNSIPEKAPLSGSTLKPSVIYIFYANTFNMSSNSFPQKKLDQSQNQNQFYVQQKKPTTSLKEQQLIQKNHYLSEQLQSMKNKMVAKPMLENHYAQPVSHSEPCPHVLCPSVFIQIGAYALNSSLQANFTKIKSLLPGVYAFTSKSPQAGLTRLTIGPVSINEEGQVIRTLKLSGFHNLWIKKTAF